MPQRIQWVEAEETVASNRRIQTRHVVAVPITLTVDGTPHSCTMLNLSLGGAQVLANTKFSMGQRVQVSFQVPTMAEPIEVGGTVRWSNAEGVGVQFDGLRARDVWALNEYFKQLPS
jgi:Tfp pilus assembly protein PilZ